MFGLGTIKPIFFCFWIAFVAFANSALADRITVYAISAPSPTLWDSPHALLKSTIQNSVKSTYMPNGHVMILLEQGDQAWLTSMASAKKFQTFSTTVRRGLGLSSLYHDFDGTLDSAEDSVRILNNATQDERVAEIEIKVDPKLMSQMLKFMDQWIRQGSFRHYRGGQIASPGLGAGCSDFVMWFMNRALNARAPLKAWMREMYLPKDLLEGTSPVSIYRRYEWAKSAEDGKHFMIPDPELIYQWVVGMSPTEKKVTLTAEQILPEQVHYSGAQILDTPFASPYPAETDEIVQGMWNNITVR